MNAPRKWSIITKLTLLYTLSLSTILVVMMLLWSCSLTTGLNKIANNVSIAGINLLSSMMRKYPDNPTLLKREITEILTEWGSADNFYYFRILDKDHHEILETPGMDQEFGNLRFPDAAPISALPDTSSKATLSGGRYFLLMTTKIQLGNREDDIRYVQLGLNTSIAHQIFSQYLTQLVFILFIGVVFAGVLGWLLARKSMRSLQDMTHAAEAITIEQLHQRLTPTDWPKELTSLAQAFNRMLDRIEQSFNRLSQFSADLAHEFRTPINNLMGEAEIALSRNRSLEEYKEVIASSLEEYHRLTHMIDSLLFLARAENSTVMIEKKLVGVSALFETVCNFFEILAEEKNITIHYHETTLQLAADPILLRRAINNLVSNAIRHTASQGTITLLTKQDSHNDQLIISDTGCGIPKHHLSRITDRFYRVTSTHTSSSNIGLGLAIVKSIMELHKGFLEITSQDGQGTTIILHFPRHA